MPNSLQLDGIDIFPVLFENAAFPTRTLYWQYGDQQAVRQEKWKWIKPSSSSDAMLFDLEADLAEQNDASGQCPDIAHKLAALYNAWYVDVKQR